MINLTKITGFDWDDGNARKNDKHGVSIAEAEQVFFNEPLLMIADTKHSQGEHRFYALGKTDEGRTLHITFTLRNAGEKTISIPRLLLVLLGFHLFTSG